MMYLVIKLLRKNIGYNEKLQKIMVSNGGFDIMDTYNDFYMVKFNLPEDKDTITLE